ncbi:hypothetical protein GPECTOR_352g107 [Gonium pectorale]|uniref:Uncharacterized protein n=1 Tax=Gonium pectorale TaxID=33097 RepID=A0A150FVJ6_GONPE|nr:hypothetical protein GPECTOR_352g107 [Gonium pectorale]|eukprot:KXZ41634.1 hypothetical protein GPECTOR_352g107 [Gonium pectorale]
MGLQNAQGQLQAAIAAEKPPAPKRNKADKRAAPDVLRRSGRLQEQDTAPADESSEEESDEEENGQLQTVPEDEELQVENKEKAAEQLFAPDIQRKLEEWGVDVNSMAGKLLSWANKLDPVMIKVDAKEAALEWYQDFQYLESQGLRDYMTKDVPVLRETMQLGDLAKNPACKMLPMRVRLLDAVIAKSQEDATPRCGTTKRRKSGLSGGSDTGQSRRRCPNRVMRQLEVVFGDALTSRSTYKEVEDKAGKLKMVINHFGIKKIGLLLGSKHASHEELVEKLDRIAAKRASNTYSQRKTHLGGRKRTREVRRRRDDPGDDQVGVEDEEEGEEGAAASDDDQMPEKRPNMWPVEVPSTGEDYSSCSSHVEYLRKFPGAMADDGVILVGSSDKDSIVSLSCVGSALLINPIEETADPASSVRVIVMGRNNTHRSKYLYFPPSTVGGSNRQHALEYQDGGATKQLLSRFKVIEWPVTGLLPNMGGMTGRRMAEHMFGFDNKASDTCKTLIEKERTKA